MACALPHDYILPLIVPNGLQPVLYSAADWLTGRPSFTLQAHDTVLCVFDPRYHLRLTKLSACCHQINPHSSAYVMTLLLTYHPPEETSTLLVESEMPLIQLLVTPGITTEYTMIKAEQVHELYAQLHSSRSSSSMGDPTPKEDDPEEIEILFENKMKKVSFASPKRQRYHPYARDEEDSD